MKDDDFNYRICENCNTRCQSAFCLKYDFCGQIHSDGCYKRTGAHDSIIAITLLNEKLAKLRKK